MKNKISIIVLVVLMLSVTACGSNTASNSDNTTQSTAVAENPNDGKDNPRGGPSGHMMGEQADLRGEVDSISGNQIALKLIEMPSFNKDNKPPQDNGKNAGDNKQSQDSGKSAGDKKPADSSSQPPQMSMNYTGETKTITIPDGVTISSNGRGLGDSEQETLSVSDIKKGNILQIWYSDEAKETISKVSVMQAMPTGKNPPDKR